MSYVIRTTTRRTRRIRNVRVCCCTKRGCVRGGVHLRRRDAAALMVLPLLVSPSAIAQQQDEEEEDNNVLKKEKTSAELRGIAKEVLRMNLPRLPAVLRLVFHDAGTFVKDEDASATDTRLTSSRDSSSSSKSRRSMRSNGGSGGANASIRFELDRGENAGLKRAIRVIDALHERVLASDIERCGYADCIALAGATAVELCGGPRVETFTGRRDASRADNEGLLPAEDSGAVALKANFERMGLSVRDLVALSGAHTLGGKGFGDPATFDNSYYKALLERPWEGAPEGSNNAMIGIPTDHALALDEEALTYIHTYAESEKRFFEDFESSFAALSLLGTGLS